MDAFSLNRDQYQVGICFNSSAKIAQVPAQVLAQVPALNAMRPMNALVHALMHALVRALVLALVHALVRALVLALSSNYMFVHYYDVRTLFSRLQCSNYIFVRYFDMMGQYSMFPYAIKTTTTVTTNATITTSP